MNIWSATNCLKSFLENNFHLADASVVKAYNFLADFIEKEKDSTLDNNELMFKLYILGISTYRDVYKTSIGDLMPINELHKFLNKGLDYHISKFCSDLNSEEQLRVYNNLDMSKLHPVLISDERHELDMIKLMEGIKDVNFQNALFGQSWNEVEVKENLELQFYYFLNE